MDKLSLYAEERQILGKKVKNLRKRGSLPAHVFGKALNSESVAVVTIDFLKTFHLAGETGVIELKIGSEKIRPVLVRDVQYDPIGGQPIHIDFYQVDLTKKVKVPVPLLLIGEAPEKVHLGEAILLQTLNEVEVEALPADLIEKIEVDTSLLKEIDDAITIGQLNYDREKLTIAIDSEEIVVKLAPAVTAEMEKLLEEQAAEAVAAQAEAAAEEGVVPAEGEVAAQGEAPTEAEAPAKGEEAPAEVNEEPKKE